MKVEIDFLKNKSLGNVYDTSKPDNKKSFEDALALYCKNKGNIDGWINESLERQDFSNGGSMSIPILYCIDMGFIKSLEFDVEKIENDTCFLSLKHVSF
jgi:hypothetical protein